jgi:hypothetical protein
MFHLYPLPIHMSVLTVCWWYYHMCRLVHIGDSEFSDGVHEFFTTTKMGSSNNILKWDFYPNMC